MRFELFPLLLELVGTPDVFETEQFHFILDLVERAGEKDVPELADIEEAGIGIIICCGRRLG